MFNGKNNSGKEFDVIDQDGDVLGSFDDIGDALACGKSAPWWAGKCNIRRDREIVLARHVDGLAIKACVRAELEFGAL